jgi:amidase
VNPDLAGLDATAQAELVRTGEASPPDLVEAAIERIEALNPRLNAVIHELFEEARAEAAGPIPDGPFRGVPFLHKDIGAALAGQPLHMGMRALREAGFRAVVDTYLARRFREAGLVSLGKTNVPELGILPTTEPEAYGPTPNPWDPSRSAGGSSGGSAAAVASGMVPIAHANDGGGSIRIPASSCGLVGLKPSRQRISEGPLIGDSMSGLTCELIVSRSVRDTARVLDAVHGPAPGDPYVAPPPARPYADELEADPAPMKLGIMTRSLAGLEVDPVVVEAARDAARLLESLGHAVEDSAPAGFEEMNLVDNFLARWSAGVAGSLALLGSVLGRELGPDDVEPLTWALAEQGQRVSAPEYLGAINRHQVMSRMIADWYERDGFDLLLTPTLGTPPPPLGSYDDSGPDPMAAMERAKRTAAFTGSFNVTGQPAISLPLYWDGDGLPIGVQLVAPLGREDLLIRLAAQLERARPWADRRPPAFAGVEAPATS